MTTPIDPNQAVARLRLLADAVEASPEDAQTIHDALSEAGIERPTGDDMSVEEEVNSYADLMTRIPLVAGQAEVQQAVSSLRENIPTDAAARREIDWTLVAFIVGCILVC